MKPFVTLLLPVWLPYKNSLSGKLGIVPSVGEQVKICVFRCSRSLQKVILAEEKKKEKAHG